MRRVTTFSYSKLLSLTSNNQTHNISPPSLPSPRYLHPSVRPDMVCLCLWCCDSSAPAAFSLHSFHPRSPRGRPHLSESLPQCEGTRQMQDLADGRQAHSRTTSTSCVLYGLPPSMSGRIRQKIPSVRPEKSRICWRKTTSTCMPSALKL